jgi:outer membrane protein assembly factor BamB
VDAESGEQQWAFETGGSVYSSPTVADRTVYVGSGDNNLYAVDAESGEQQWAFETGDNVSSSPMVSDGTVYVGSGDNNLYAVDAESGEQQWAFETGDYVYSSPTVANGTVYVGSHDNNLYAMNAGSGDQEWVFETGNEVRSSPTVANGTVYVGSLDTTLYAVGTDHTKSSSGSRARLETLGHHVQSPTARFSVTPPQPVTGTTVAFDASNSSGGAEIVGYEWDFTGDGTTDATGRQVTHTYDEEGTYTITLTVTDSDGATAPTTQTVTVLAPEETEQDTDTSGSTTFSYTPSAPRVDTTVTFDANNFPSDATAASYEWDFDGDGTANAFGSTVKYIFSSGGIQTVTLTAGLESGETETIRQSVLVNTPPEPGFSISPSPAIIEEPTTFDASETTDSTGSIESYKWDFDGDGTTDKTGRAVTHTFAEEGRPTVTLRVTDTQGVTATESRSILVQRAATFSVQLRDTTITPDGETTAAITVNNLLGSDRLLTQLELDLPSGWDVTFVDAASAGGGTATEIFETQAGQTRTIRAQITPNDTGEFSVGGRAFYYIGDQSPPRHTRQLNSGTLTVTDGETTSESTASPTEEPPATASGETTQTGTETSTSTPGLGVGTGATALGTGLGVLRALDLLDDDDPDQSEKE